MKEVRAIQSVVFANIVCFLSAQAGFAQVSIDSVYVGDIGNPNNLATGYGRVDYGYAIGKYEVTFAQYAAFLNAVAARDTYGLYNPQWGITGSTRIFRTGDFGSYVYSLGGQANGNLPINFVSWFDAARFVNWLQNGQPIGLQGSGTTETGAYTLNGATSGTTLSRNANANYALPSGNEWYKAAYYQPTALGGDIDSYWQYPTASNIIPNSRNGSMSDPNSANFYRDDGIANGFNDGYAVTGPFYPGDPLTEVGKFSLARGFYGTSDQAGNVWEWTEEVSGSSRGIRGGGWTSGEYLLGSTAQVYAPPTEERNDRGFRIVIVPEPTTTSLVVLGILLTSQRRVSAKSFDRQASFRAMQDDTAR